MVCDETLLVLSTDPVLKQPAAAKVVGTLLELLRADSKGRRHNEGLARHVARELLQVVESTYVDGALAQLATILLSDPPEGSPHARQEKIAHLTGGLLSTLIDGGASLESLYQLYRQILLPSSKSQRYVFRRKLGLLAAILRQEAKEYRVLFSIDNVTDIHNFPAAMGGTDLQAFVTSVDELLSPDKFLQEGRDRVISAFRLYRLGADTNSFENKLAN
jgi:hypothetical protein